jgi:putative intracellular protease/amidase
LARTFKRPREVAIMLARMNVLSRIVGVMLSLFTASACATAPEPAPALEHRGGKVLFVLTGADTQVLANGKTRRTGYFLGEFYEAWRAVVDAGYEGDVATPNGDPAPIDPESLDAKYWSDHPSWRDEARAFVASAPALREPMTLDDALARQSEYVGLVIPGGQGVMTDLVHDERMHALVQHLGADGRAVGLICHAPAILAHLPRGNPFEGRRVTSVTGFEEFYIERFVMHARAKERAIGRTLEKLGYAHIHAAPGRPFATRDQNLVTSQNPFSGPSFATHYLTALAESPHRD